MSLFDQSSGQVYTETTPARVRSMIPTWMTQARGRRENPSEYQNRGHGCSTLQQMTLRFCVWQADLMEPGALQWLGWHYASRIYEHLKWTDTLTFNTWSIFQKAFPEQIDRHHHFHTSEPDAWSLVPAQLPSMIDRLAKLHTNMLTFLCVRNFSLTLDHLIPLTKIDSLAGLVIEQLKESRHQDLSARYVSDWGRAVCEKGAFKKLRLLVLYDSQLGKDTVLKPLSCFPALALVGVHDYRGMEDEIRKPCEDWCVVSPEWLIGKTAEPDRSNPRSIWDDPKTTKAHKMQLLYDLCGDLLQQTPVKTTAKSSVCLSYLSKECFGPEHCIAWFFREPRAEASHSINRRTIQPDNDEKRAHPNKKRKVRNSKQVDLGSLLSSFT